MAKTITEGFQAFYSRLEPLSSEREKAVKHKDSVKSCLANNFQCYSIIETGSFGNGTGVRHYSDTDYFAPIPVGVLSNDSSYFLRKLKGALQNTFWKTSGIEVNSPAVLIPFGQYASENLEVTPCNFRGMSSTPLGNYPKYLIPDGNGGWMAASPQAHNAYVKSVDEKLRGKLKPLVKFVKAWKFMNDVPILSFHLELRITKFLEDSVVFAYDENILNIFSHLNQVQLADMRDPMGISGLISSTQTYAQRSGALSKLNTALTRAEKAYNARVKDKTDDAFYWWNMLYNGNFPAR